jgi:hypothetical protein
LDVAPQSAQSPYGKIIPTIQLEMLLYLILHSVYVAAKQCWIVLTESDHLMPNLSVAVLQQYILTIGSQLEGKLEWQLV